MCSFSDTILEDLREMEVWGGIKMQKNSCFHRIPAAITFWYRPQLVSEFFHFYFLLWFLECQSHNFLPLFRKPISHTKVLQTQVLAEPAKGKSASRLCISPPSGRRGCWTLTLFPSTEYKLDFSWQCSPGIFMGRPVSSVGLSTLRIRNWVPAMSFHNYVTGGGKWVCFHSAERSWSLKDRVWLKKMERNGSPNLNKWV